MLDGDSLNYYWPQDQFQFKYLSRLATHNGVFDLKKPWGQLNGGFAMSKQLASMVSLWLDHANRA